MSKFNGRVISLQKAITEYSLGATNIHAIKIADSIPGYLTIAEVIPMEVLTKNPPQDDIKGYRFVKLSCNSGAKLNIDIIDYEKSFIKVGNHIATIVERDSEIVKKTKYKDSKGIVRCSSPEGKDNTKAITLTTSVSADAMRTLRNNAELVKELYIDKNYTAALVANHFGDPITEAAVVRYVKEAKLKKLLPLEIPEDVQKKVMEMHSNGVSKSKIALDLNISKRAVDKSIDLQGGVAIKSKTEKKPYRQIDSIHVIYKGQQATILNKEAFRSKMLMLREFGNAPSFEEEEYYL